MTIGREGQAGVTLIEMLAALAVSALIGVAGFSLLESVLQTEAGVADRLDKLVQQDRTFQLLALDLQQALAFETVDDEGIALDFQQRTVVWRGTATGLQRLIKRPNRPDVIQATLPYAAELAVDRRNVPVVRVSMPELDLWRVFALPPETAP